MKEEFFEEGGIFTLTKFLSNNNDPVLKEKCLHAFANASMFEEEYKLRIAEEGLFDTLTDFIQHDKDSSLETKELCFTILANLCKDC